MSEIELTAEEKVLQMMKRILTDVARETNVAPGLKHPLSDATIMNIRDCLGLIVSRERELAEQAGRPMNMRPRYVDEPQKTVVVSLDKISVKKNNKEEKP